MRFEICIRIRLEECDSIVFNSGQVRNLNDESASTSFSAIAGHDAAARFPQKLHQNLNTTDKLQPKQCNNRSSTSPRWQTPPHNPPTSPTPSSSAPTPPPPRRASSAKRSSKSPSCYVPPRHPPQMRVPLVSAPVPQSSPGARPKSPSR